MPIINSWIIKHLLVFGDVPVLRWMMNNTKKVDNGNNTIYGKIERKYRKNDTWMALAAAATQEEKLEETTNVEIEELEVITI